TPRFYGAIDVLAHPSFEEPFGLVVVEAMASERPVVAINGGGVPEIVRNGRDGLLVPAEDASAMAEAIGQVLENGQLAQELGRVGVGGGGSVIFEPKAGGGGFETLADTRSAGPASESSRGTPRFGKPSSWSTVFGTLTCEHQRSHVSMKTVSAHSPAVTTAST